MKTTQCMGRICIDGKPLFMLGVNYWPRRLSVEMWKRLELDAVREDVELMKKLGLRFARIFIVAEDFADENARVKPEKLGDLRKVLDVFHDAGIGVFVTLLVGHMSGKNFKLPWTSFSEFYEAGSLYKTGLFIKQIVESIKDHPAVAGWIISNELSLAARARDRGEALTALEYLVKVIKDIDREHVVSSGDIPDQYMQETPNVKKTVDYIGPHLYLYALDQTRHGYMYGAFLDFFSNYGSAPVLLEEFGFSTHQFSDESISLFLYETLYTSLAHGASGAFIWCFSDFNAEDTEPYVWRPFELGFGIVRADGSLKEQALMVSRFSRELEVLESQGFPGSFRRLIDTAVVIPYYVFRDYEFVYYRNSYGWWNTVEPVIGSIMLASSAGLNPSAIYELELDRLTEETRFIVYPSAISGLTRTWRWLLDFTSRGGVLYSSIYRGLGGRVATHESPSHLWSELFGVTNATPAGSIGIVYYGRLVLSFTRRYGLFGKGESISITLPEPLFTFSLKPEDAEVVAVDEIGRPVLVVSKRGDGYTILSTIPFESISNRIPLNEWMTLSKLYSSIAIEHLGEPLKATLSPEVEVSIHRGDIGNMYILVNHSQAGASGRVRLLGENASIEPLIGGEHIVEKNSNEIAYRIPGKHVIVLKSMH